jgi:hypothetical protein
MAVAFHLGISKPTPTRGRGRAENAAARPTSAEHQGRAEIWLGVVVLVALALLGLAFPWI